MEDMSSLWAALPSTRGTEVKVTDHTAIWWGIANILQKDPMARIGVFRNLHGSSRADSLLYRTRSLILSRNEQRDQANHLCVGKINNECIAWDKGAGSDREAGGGGEGTLILFPMASIESPSAGMEQFGLTHIFVDVDIPLAKKERIIAPVAWAKSCRVVYLMTKPKPGSKGPKQNEPTWKT
jgi:hypothetical protein